jgi:hypothetical protein
MDLSRRALLCRAAVGAGALLGGSVLAGCGVDARNIRWDDDTPVPKPTPGPDELARRRAADTAQSLLATCSAAATARPDLEGLLTVVREQHSEHLVALGVRPQQTPDPSATATTGSPAPVSPAASATAGSDPVGDLVARHTAGASEAMTDTGTTSGGLAVLLAQVAACRAVQARQLAAALRAPVPPDPAPATAPPPAATGAPGAGQGAAPSSGTGVSPSAQVPSATATRSAPSLTKQAQAALAEAIDGEHAAVYGYGVLATRLRGAERGRALAELANHQRIAGQLAGVYEASGEKPPAAAPGYRLPGPITDAALVGHTSGELRAVAVDLVLQRALAAHSWGAEPTAFPGRA